MAKENLCCWKVRRDCCGVRWWLEERGKRPNVCMCKGDENKGDATEEPQKMKSYTVVVINLKETQDNKNGQTN